MSLGNNRDRIEKYAGKTIYLFDTGVFARSEEIQKFCGINFVDVFKKLPNEHFFISNEVLCEISNSRNLNYDYFLNHLLNAEGSMDPNWKENRFLFEENGEIKIVVLNKVSRTDYMQVLLCQNHEELILVSNDRKLLKSAVQVIPGQVLGVPVLVERLRRKYSDIKELEMIGNTLKQIYKLKNPFGGAVVEEVE